MLYKAAYTTFAESDGPTKEQLARIDSPALFVTGADEPNSTPQMSRAMAELAPNGQAKVLLNAAHMMPMTHAEEVKRHPAETSFRSAFHDGPWICAPCATPLAAL